MVIDSQVTPAIFRSIAVLGVKPVPVICTEVPGGPLPGDIANPEVTVKLIDGILPMLTK